MNSLVGLSKNNWIKEHTIPFSEAIAKLASECYTHINSNNTQLALLFYPDKSVVRIRLGSTNGNDFNYFEIKADGNETKIAEKIDALKGSADISNYFSFYFALQSVSDSVSILAWEQWEKDYK